MGDTLNVIDLIPTERHNVKFPNGKLIDAVHMEEMEPRQYAAFIQMQTRANKMEDVLAGAELGDPEEAVRTMDEMHSILGDMLKALMPDLDDETLGSAPFFVRGKIVEWLSEKNKPAPKVMGQESQN